MINSGPKVGGYTRWKPCAFDVQVSVGFSSPCSRSGGRCSLALTELKYVSAKTRDDIIQKNPRAKGLTQEERTPKQADHANEHETEV